MKKTLIFLIFFILFYAEKAYTQNCSAKKVHAGHCKEPFDIDYEDTGKSLSFPLTKGRTQKLVVTLPGKKDYYFAVCTENEDELRFKIKNANNPNEIIFDNSKDFDIPQFIEFSMLFTNKLLFEITLPLVHGASSANEKTCVGMLLFSKDN
jgi:hypothetical protein